MEHDIKNEPDEKHIDHIIDNMSQTEINGLRTILNDDTFTLSWKHIINGIKQ